MQFELSKAFDKFDFRMNCNNLTTCYREKGKELRNIQNTVK